MEKNGGKPAATPAMDAQMALALVQGVDRLTKEVGVLKEGLEQLKGEAGEIRGAISDNQQQLRTVGGLLADLGTAAQLALHRLPPAGAAPARSELAARMRAARGEWAVILEQLTGQVYALRGEVVRRIDSLEDTHQAIINEMRHLVEERFDDGEGISTENAAGS